MRMLHALPVGGSAPKPPGFIAFFRQNGMSLALIQGDRFCLSPAFPAAEPLARVASQHCPIPSGSGRIIINHAVGALNQKAANGTAPLNFVSHVWGSPQSALKPPLRGEPRHRCVPALFAGVQRASGLGGTRPPRLSPGGGNGKGGVQTSLLPQAFGACRVCLAPMAGTPLVECALALLPPFSPLRSPTYMSIRSIRFPEVLLVAPPTPLPCFYPHSEWAAMGPVQVGVRSQAQVHHHG